MKVKTEPMHFVQVIQRAAESGIEGPAQSCFNRMIKLTMTDESNTAHSTVGPYGSWYELASRRRSLKTLQVYIPAE